MRRWIQLFLIILAIVMVDQVTKRLVVTTLAVGESIEPIPALREVFQITHSQNTGAAFGFLPQAGVVFLVVAVVVVVAMVYFYPRVPVNQPLTRIAIGLVCGGALGNALDRVTGGVVIDFIHYQIPRLISNVSNIADHAIVLGVLLILFDSWRAERQHKEAVEEESSPPETLP
jgi:signal peptidase II